MGSERSDGVDSPDRAEQWRQAALAFERRAMRVELVIRLLVSAGHVTQDKVDQAFSIAGSLMPSGVKGGGNG